MKDRVRTERMEEKEFIFIDWFAVCSDNLNYIIICLKGKIKCKRKNARNQDREL